MESALIVLVWIIGLVVITFFVVIIIAVLKVTSDYDDISDRIQIQTIDALKNREGTNGEPTQAVGDGRGTALADTMGEDIRN